MCYAASTLFYGITVNAIELCTAAQGYLRVEPALLAVDLIRARRRDGLLKTDSPPHTGGVRAIPVELWDSIRDMIVDQSFVDHCEITARSYDDEYWEDDEAESGAPTWRLSPGSGMASLFSTNRSAWEPFMVDGGVPAFTGLNELVRPFPFRWELSALTGPPSSEGDRVSVYLRFVPRRHRLEHHERGPTQRPRLVVGRRPLVRQRDWPAPLPDHHGVPPSR